MTLFRRRPKVDKTQPLPAPPFLKWVVSKAGVRYEGDSRAVYDLGLFPVDVEVDEWGIYTRPHRGDMNFAKGAKIPHTAEASEWFQHRDQIRRTSKRVLKQYHTRVDEVETFASLRGSIR